MSSDERSSTIFNRFQLLGYFALCLIWGSTWLAIRIVVSTVPPLLAAGVRFAAAAVVLLTLAALQKRRWPRGPEQWRALGILSLTIMAVPYGLLFWAEQYVTSAMTAVIFYAFPLMVALLTPLMMHRTVPRSAVFAMVVAFAGIVYLLYRDRDASPRMLLGGS